jgi:hypothetical protein
MTSLFRFAFLVLLFLPNLAFAQEDGKTSFWGVGLGLQTTAWKDQMVTQSTYHGTNLFFSINHRKEKNKTLRHLDIDSSIGSLKTDMFDRQDQRGKFIQPSISHFWNEIQYRHLFNIHQSDSESWYIGGAAYHLLSLRIGTRWDNSQINYDIGAGLKAEGGYRRQLPVFGKNTSLYLGMQVPLVGYLVRPSFTGVPDILDINKDFLTDMFGNNQVTWIGNFPRMQLRAAYDWPIAFGNMLQLVYQWQYFSFEKPWQTQTSAHSLSVNFMLRAK